MINESVQQADKIKVKANELGIAEDIIRCALDILYKNKNLVNAIDNRVEMDEYIYRSIIKIYTDRRKSQAEADILSEDTAKRSKAEKDLHLLSRDELTTDPNYRAVLPIIIKVVTNEPILRLHADEASELILKLADFKRKHRATSLTEVIVTKCSAELDD